MKKLIKGLKAPVNKKGNTSALSGASPTEYAVFIATKPLYSLDLLMWMPLVFPLFPYEKTLLANLLYLVL